MQRRQRTIAAGVGVATLALVAGLTLGQRGGNVADATAGPASHTSGDPRGLTFSSPTSIDNRYLPLTSVRRCTLAGEQDGVVHRSVRTRLDRTETFDVAGNSIEAVVIEDRAYDGKELVEVALDYFAQADNGVVYYLGEDVDNYEDGTVVDHDGSWRYGRDTQALGVAMPAAPAVGDTWRFEDAPGITVEADEVITHFDSVDVGETTYRDVIRVREDVSGDGVSEQKYYAPDVGEIRSVAWDFNSVSELAGCTSE